MVELVNPENKTQLSKIEDQYVDQKGNRFQVVNGVLRLVSGDNYTSNFGFQWNKFPKTQLDGREDNLNLSAERFFAATGWDKENLEGQNILEVGSGAGRFSKIVLESTQANLYSIDYSEAVFTNFQNNGHYGDRLKLFQASIYEMPFPDQSFDKVFCFGVLQHTPDFKKAVKCLTAKAKVGGEVIVDFYPINGWWTKIHSKYLLRPTTRKMSNEKLLKLIDRNVNWLISLYFFFEKIKVGRFINRFLPICDIKRTMPGGLSKEKLREWVMLDTFDMFSPQYDHPQKVVTVKRWFEEFNMKVTFAGYVSYGKGMRAAIVRGIKKIN